MTAEDSSTKSTKRVVRLRAGWTLEEGIAFARTIQEIVLPLRYWTSLGGSVLYKGQAKKDLDLVIAPFNKNDCVPPEQVIAAILEKMPGVSHEWTREWIHDQWRQRGITDTKHVEAFRIDDADTWRRFDLFFLS